jgi:hypothetical protein
MNCLYYSSNPFEVPATVVIYLQQPARVSAIYQSLPLICVFDKILIYCFQAVLLIRKISCFIPSLIASVTYYNLVLVLFSASFSMRYFSQLDWGSNRLTSSLD